MYNPKTGPSSIVYRNWPLNPLLYIYWKVLGGDDRKQKERTRYPESGWRNPEWRDPNGRRKPAIGATRFRLHWHNAPQEPTPIYFRPSMANSICHIWHNDRRRTRHSKVILHWELTLHHRSQSEQCTRLLSLSLTNLGLRFRQAKSKRQKYFKSYGGLYRGGYHVKASSILRRIMREIAILFYGVQTVFSNKYLQLRSKNLQLRSRLNFHAA
jgi:hypothetical protein